MKAAESLVKEKSLTQQLAETPDSEILPGLPDPPAYSDPNNADPIPRSAPAPEVPSSVPTPEQPYNLPAIFLVGCVKATSGKIPNPEEFCAAAEVLWEGAGMPTDDASIAAIARVALAASGTNPY